MSLPPLPLIDGTLFVDNSGWLEGLQSCHRLVEYKSLFKRIGAGEKPALNFGSVIHLCLEHRYRSYGVEEVGPNFWNEIGDIVSQYYDSHPSPIDDWRTSNWAITLFKKYMSRYPIEEFSLLLGPDGKPIVELPFTLPLYIHKSSLGTIPVVYTGRIDLPIGVDKEVWVSDHKTSGMLGQTFFDRMKRSAQQKGYCFSGDTELLTPTGWKQIKEIQAGEKVAQWEEGFISFVSPTAFFSKTVNEDLISYSGSVELLTTAEHRLLIKDRQSNKYKETTAAKLPLSPNYRIPCSGTYLYLSDSNEHESNELILAAMVQADGHITPSNTLRFHFQKERKIERCRSNLNKLGIAFTETLCPDGTTTFLTTGNSSLVNRIIILLSYKKQWGSWLLQANAVSLEIFMEEVKHWDGSDRGNKGFIYSTEHENNAKWIQTIATLVRRRASIHTQWQEGKLQWRVNVSLEKTEIGTGGLTKTLVPYTGSVFCLNVPSTWLLTKRNDVISIAGNCWSFQELTGMKVSGYMVNAIRTKEPPLYINDPSKRQGKSNPETWWNENFQREKYYIAPGMLEEWKQNTIELIETFFWHYSKGFMPESTTYCTMFGKCPYFDICCVEKENRGTLLASGLYTDNVWSPLHDSTEPKQ